MRLVLTGSNGFVGRAITRLASERGHQILGVGRAASAAQPIDAYLRHDLTQNIDPDASRVLSAFEPEAIIHCAALASPWAAPHVFESINIGGTGRVLDWAYRHGKLPVHYISSSSIFYRRADQFGINEASPIPADRHQINTYSRTKRAGERLVQGYPGAWTVLRPRAVFGPGDTVLLPRLVDAANAGQLPLFVRRNPEPVRCDLTYVDTVADYVLRAATGGAEGDYNLVTGEPVELYRFITGFLERIGVPAPTRRIPIWLGMALAGGLELNSIGRQHWREPRITRFGISMFAWSKTFDVAKLRRDLGEPLVSVDEGIDRLVAWWQSAGAR